MKFQDVVMLLLLAAIWGASFLFIRIASLILGPVVLMDLRVLLAGAALLLYAITIRHLPALWSRWKAYALLGALNAALPFTLIATAELHLPATLAAILNATTPLFTAVIAAFWMKDRFTAKKAVGLILGVLGVGILMGWSPLALNGIVLLSVGASLLAACFYGIGGVYSKVAFQGTPPLALAIGQQLGAGLLLFPFAALRLPPAWPSISVMLAVLALALLSTSIGYLLYFQLMRSVGPTKTLSVTFLVPVFALLWGTLFLKEALGVGTFLGLAVILISIVCVADVRIRPAVNEKPIQSVQPGENFRSGRQADGERA